MTIIGKWLPPKRDTTLVLASCVFVVFSWSILWFFYRMPGWLPYLDIWGIVGIFAYSVASSLLESILLLLLLIALAVVLPARWFRDRFAAQGSLLVFLLLFWAALLQTILNLRMWSPDQFLPGLVLPIMSIMVASILVHRSKHLAQAIRALAERLTVFLALYLPLGFLGLAVVLVRNIL